MFLSPLEKAGPAGTAVEAEGGTRGPLSLCLWASFSEVPPLLVGPGSHPEAGTQTGLLALCLSSFPVPLWVRATGLGLEGSPVLPVDTWVAQLLDLLLPSIFLNLPREEDSGPSHRGKPQGGCSGPTHAHRWALFITYASGKCFQLLSSEAVTRLGTTFEGSQGLGGKSCVGMGHQMCFLKI